MGIWAEIKKAINSNLNKPLNTLIEESTSSIDEKIDRYVDENKIGHGFITSASATLNSPDVDKGWFKRISTGSFNLHQPHFVKHNDSLYAIGTASSSYGSTECFYKSDTIGGGMTTSAGALPYVFCRGTAFSYNNYIYIMGGEYSTNDLRLFYRYDGTKWTKLSSLPFDFASGYSYVYKDKVYVTEHTNANNKGNVLVYDGSTWTTINIGNGKYLWGFFEKDNKLYVVDETLTKFYYLDEATSTFVLDSDNFPATAPTDAPNSYGFFFVGISGKLHYVINTYVYTLEENKWIPYNHDNGSVYVGASMANAIHEGVIYACVNTVYSNDVTYMSITTSQYKEYSFFLPRGVIMGLENSDVYTIAPVTNCEVTHDNSVRVIDDGTMVFRLIECNNTYRAVFR